MSLCFLLSSCSPPLQRYDRFLQIDKPTENRLYTLRIEQWGNVKFSGLLALQLNSPVLSYAMLDATGIKLIEAEVGLQGDCRIKRAMAGLAGSALPGYLSTSLARIFLMSPSSNPCSRNGLVVFCCFRSEDSEHKIMKIEPFTLWEVQRDKGAIIYLQPWLGIRMTFTDLNKA